MRLLISLARCCQAAYTYDVSLKADCRWNHVYRCYRRSLQTRYGFAELCFQCDNWVTDKSDWSTHCQLHLDDSDTLPVQFDPLMFRKTLARAGQCPFCLFDPSLEPHSRFRQFQIKQTWVDHVQEHFEELDEQYDLAQGLEETKKVMCPDPRCAAIFEAVSDLKEHCQDVHCIRIRKHKSRCQKQQRIERPNNETKYDFIFYALSDQKPEMSEVQHSGAVGTDTSIQVNGADLPSPHHSQVSSADSQDSFSLPASSRRTTPIPIDPQLQ